MRAVTNFATNGYREFFFTDFDINVYKENADRYRPMHDRRIRLLSSWKPFNATQAWTRVCCLTPVDSKSLVGNPATNVRHDEKQIGCRFRCYCSWNLIISSWETKNDVLQKTVTKKEAITRYNDGSTSCETKVHHSCKKKTLQTKVETLHAENTSVWYLRPSFVRHGTKKNVTGNLTYAMGICFGYRGLHEESKQTSSDTYLHWCHVIEEKNKPLRIHI